MNKIMDEYTWDAEDYSNNSTAQRDWARELILKLNLKGTESVIDIGCGEGKITAEIASQLPGGKILGIDRSNNMIDLAKKNYPQLKYPNLSFKMIDARNLQFKEEFDIVFSNAALHWIKDHSSVISEIKNSLKSQGRLLLQMGGKGNAESLISILGNMMAKKEWNKYFHGFEFPYGFYESETYILWLKEAGLNPIRVELIQKKMSYKNKEDLAGWIRTTWHPYTNCVPIHKRTEFINKLIKEYLEKYPLDNKGCVHVDMVRLEVDAIRSSDSNRTIGG